MSSSTQPGLHKGAMRLRKATTRDLHRLTEITTTSLIDDATYDYMWPHRKRFPEDNFFWWQLRLEAHLYDKTMAFLLIEIDGDGQPSCQLHSDSDTDNKSLATNTSNASRPPAMTEAASTDRSRRADQTPESTIISYAVWQRMGRDRAARERFARENDWMNVLDATAASVQRWSIDRKYQRRDGDPARLAAIAEATEQVKKKYFSDSPDWWSLELLVTDRPYRRRGAATALVRWGIAAGDQEGVFCAVEASAMGSPLYQHLGFEKLATWTVQVPGDPGKLDYDVMRRNPKPDQQQVVIEKVNMSPS